MLFHVSKTENLKVLVPKVSTHGTPFVYAIDNLYIALLFGAPKDDFDLLIDLVDGKAIVSECYENAFKEIYENQECSVYQVEDSTFLRNKTGWSPELVSKEPVQVVKEWKVDNLYNVLMQEVKNGNILLYTYNNSIEYRGKISNHIVDRLIRFEILDDEIPAKIKEKFPRIIDGLEKLISGEYL